VPSGMSARSDGLTRNWCAQRFVGNMSRRLARPFALVGVGLLLILAAGRPARAGADAGFADLWDVSCGSPGDCAAVGTDNTNGLIFTQTNGAWAPGIRAPLPANAASTPFADVYSVSCPSALNCTAAGTYADTSGSGQGLLLTETNGSWATGTEASLPGNATLRVSQFVRLSSVSCPSAGNCAAVGTYTDTAGSGQGLLLTETNGSWATGSEALLPANALRTKRQMAGLTSISCPTAGNCTAIGTYFDSSSNLRGLLLSEHGGVWATGVEARLPGNAAADGLVNPSGHFNYGLNSVSCASAGDCSAIGEYANTAGNEQGLLLTERNGRWTRGVEARLPSNAAAGSRETYVLFSLSCPSAGACVAVGWYLDRSGYGGPLVVAERNGNWRRGVEPRLPANAVKRGVDIADELESVSCASPGNCTVVGSYSTRSKLEGLLLSEKGGKWSRAAEARLPANATQATFAISDERPALSGVSCASAAHCAAIGTYSSGGVEPNGMLLTETPGGWARGIEASVP
jgi:hypothetical protein